MFHRKNKPSTKDAKNSLSSAAVSVLDRIKDLSDREVQYLGHSVMDLAAERAERAAKKPDPLTDAELDKVNDLARRAEEWCASMEYDFCVPLKVVFGETSLNVVLTLTFGDPEFSEGCGGQEGEILFYYETFVNVSCKKKRLTDAEKVLLDTLNRQLGRGAVCDDGENLIYDSCKVMKQMDDVAEGIAKDIKKLDDRLRDAFADVFYLIRE